MTCLHRYLTREFFRFFAVIQALILVLFIFIDYLTRMDKFLETRITLLEGLWYVLLKLPYMFVQLTPAAILLAAIAVLGIMNRNNELMALKTSGISVYFLVRPLVVIACILAGIMFILGETLIPVTMSKSNYMRHHDMKKHDEIALGRHDIWIRSGATMVHINFYDPVQQTLADISATTLGEDFQIKTRVDARKGRYEAGQWILEDALVQVYDPVRQDYDVTQIPAMAMSFGFAPEDLGGFARKTDEMGFFELGEYVRKVEQEGYDATIYRVDMHGKIAFPFICIIMALAGSATGMRGFARNSLPLAVALGVVISFFYWVLFGLCLSMGYAGVLPPVVAAWISNVFFLAAGGIYLIYTE